MRTCCSLWCAFTPPDLLNMSRGWSEQNLWQGEAPRCEVSYLQNMFVHLPAVSGLFAMWLWPAKGILVTHGRWQLLADKQTVSPLPGATAAMNTTWQSSCRCEAWGVSRTPLQQHQAPKAGVNVKMGPRSDVLRRVSRAP